MRGARVFCKGRASAGVMAQPGLLYQQGRGGLGKCSADVFPQCFSHTWLSLLPPPSPFCHCAARGSMVLFYYASLFIDLSNGFGRNIKENLLAFCCQRPACTNIHLV